MTRLLQSGAVVSVLIERTAETNRAIMSRGSAERGSGTSMSMPKPLAAPC